MKEGGDAVQLLRSGSATLSVESPAAVHSDCGITVVLADTGP